MPETGEEPYDEKVEYLVFSVAAKRNIDIVAEESAQGHMPSAPEFRCRAGNIGIIEVFEEVESEDPAKTYRHIGITGEVIINLDGEHQYSEPHSCSGLLCQVSGEIGFCKLSCDVCDEYFFGKTHKESCGTGPDIIKGFLAVVYFPCNVDISYDRTCNKLGIKGNIHEIFHVVMLRFNISFINIDGIAEGLESIEADTDWESECRNRKRKTGEEIDIFHKKAAVFENTEKSKVENKRRNQSELCSDFTAVFFYQQTVDIVNGRAENKQGYPNGFAPGIEKERKENKHRISECSVFCAEIEYQVKRQKQIEKKQVCKYHIFVVRPY